MRNGLIKIRRMFLSGIGMFLLLAALWLTSCSSQDRIASSEVGNPPGGTVKGTVTAATGAPAVGARVTLLPTDYDPVFDKSKVGAPIYLDTTDAQGAYSIKGVDWNRYNLLVVDPATGTRMIIRDQVVHFDTVEISGHQTLRPPGTISMLLPDSFALKAGYVYLPGTEFHVKLDTQKNQSRMIYFDSVPAGESPPIFYRNSESPHFPGKASAAVKVAEGIKVLPEDTVPALVFEDWAYSQRIFVNTTTSGAGISSRVRDFPLLVQLEASDLDFSTAAPDGHDLRFTDKVGNPLAFEIESWNQLASKGTVWVRLDSINGNDSSQFFLMYWGNPRASIPIHSKAVFDTAFGYSSVWHLGAFESGSTQFQDASGNRNSLKARGGLTSSDLEKSPLGGAIHLDGLGRTLTTSKTFLNPNPFTISLWFKTTSDSGGKLMGFGADSGIIDTARDRHIWMDTTGKIHFGVNNRYEDGVKKLDILSGTKAYNDGAWHFVVSTLSTTGLALYIDGAKVDEDVSVKTAQVYTGYWKVGFDFNFYDWPFPPKALYFKGSVDEVRVANKVFSDEWIKLSWENERSGNRLLRFKSNR